MSAPKTPARPESVTLRQLRAFVAVAQEQSITRAAGRMHLTASALSMLVSSLEAELAVRLFERTTRRVVLTEEGQALLPSVQMVFKDLDQAFDGFIFFLDFFRTAIASGLVTVHLRTFSAPLPKRVVLNAFARRMRL